MVPGVSSAKADVLARYGGFFRGLRKSPSCEVAVMANLAGRDIRSTTGRNLAYLQECSGLDPWVFGSARLKEEILKNEAVEVPPLDEWRISYLRNLLEQRQMLHYMGDNEGRESVTILVESLCIN